MAWIKTIPLNEANGKLLELLQAQRGMYPPEYDSPAPMEVAGESIVESHTLIPAALYHAFATFGALLAPDLPLSRRHHEMIATLVSATNRCFY
jgi:alkylhydroperoxidase family enzyme